MSSEETLEVGATEEVGTEETGTAEVGTSSKGAEVDKVLRGLDSGQVAVVEVDTSVVVNV